MIRQTDRFLHPASLARLARASLAIGALGVYNYARLPIDAVPDITNVQVQINTERARLLAARSRAAHHVSRSRPRWRGIPGLDYTRSLSRYGLSQVTVVFEDGTDIYFARQQVTERLQQVKDQLPPGVETADGPDRDRPRRNLHVHGRGRSRARTKADGDAIHADRSAHRAGLDHPAAAAQRARRRRGQHHRRLREAVPRRARSRQARRLRPDLPRRHRGAGDATTPTSAPATSSATASSISSARRARSPTSPRSATSCVGHARRRARCASATSPRWREGKELRTGAATENGQRGRARHRLHADRREQPHGRRARRRAARGDQPQPLPEGVMARDGLRPHRRWSMPRSRRSRRTWSKARCWSSSCCSCCSATSAPRSSPPASSRSRC